MKEEDVYDRQIRLWGREAQEKMATAKVLYINMTCAVTEVLKNLVLAGIRAGLCDDRSPSTFSSPTLFRLDTSQPTIAEALKESVEDLNGLLGECTVVSKRDLENDSVLQEYSIVIASGLTGDEASLLAERVVSLGAKFFLVDTFGFNAACLMDLGPNCMYREEVGKKLLDPVPLTPYVPLPLALRVPLEDCVNRFHRAPPVVWKEYRDVLFHGAPTHELAPVAAVIGGLVGNEVIKALSGKGKPCNNLLMLQHTKCWGFLVQPKSSN